MSKNKRLLASTKKYFSTTLQDYKGKVKKLKMFTFLV